MSVPRLDERCIDFAELILADELTRGGMNVATSARVLSLAAALQDAATSARVLSLAAALQDAVEAWSADHAADRPDPGAP